MRFAMTGGHHAAVIRVLVALLLFAATACAGAVEPRRIAITVDDLPWVEHARTPPEVVATRFGKLVDALARYDTAAIGFVNEDKLEVDGRVDPVRVALLERWLEAGLALGNHTYGHVGMHAVAIDEYLDAIARGERVTRALVASRGTAGRDENTSPDDPVLRRGHGQPRHAASERAKVAATGRDENTSLDDPVLRRGHGQPRQAASDRAKVPATGRDENTSPDDPFLRRGHGYWFRHPYLQAGQVDADRARLAEWLHAHGYRIAPVTVDNGDWIYARAYVDALDAADAELARRLRDDYVAYMDAKVSYYEQQSKRLFGREIPQVLLCHASALNADALPALLERLRKRGYEFVPLESVVADPAYAHEDGYRGRAGISWLHRWAMAERKPRVFYEGEPVVPKWVLELAGVEGE